MISGILITAKCHMHVSQSWDLYTELKNKHVNLSGCLKKTKKTGIKRKRQKLSLMYYC